MALALLLGGGTYALYFSTWLLVDKVTVEGAAAVPTAEILQTAAVELGEPLARVDTDAVARRVAELRPVEEVSLHRSWPSTLVITVVEREAALAVRGADGLTVYDPAGVGFLDVETPPAGVPLLRATDGPPAEDVLDAVLSVVGDLPAGIASRVTEVAAPTPSSIELHLDDEVVVEWGTAESNARKAQVLAELMEYPASVYNVTAPEVPAIRPLPTGEAADEDDG